MNQISDYVLNLAFYKHTTKQGEVIHWRSCVLKPDMTHGEQGYIWIFQDGEHVHSYRTPEDL